MSKVYPLSVLFRPGMEPDERGYFEDELADALEQTDLGEITGGGTMLDGSESDIGVDVNDLEEGLRLIREVLQECEAPESTVIVQFEPERIEHRVYD